MGSRRSRRQSPGLRPSSCNRKAFLVCCRNAVVVRRGISNLRIEKCGQPMLSQVQLWHPTVARGAQSNEVRHIYAGYADLPPGSNAVGISTLLAKPERELQSLKRRPLLCRVRLERVTTEGDTGYLVFVRHSTRKQWLNGEEPGLIIQVFGDTLYCLCALLRDEPPLRPLPLDLLGQALTHGGHDGHEVVKVAITGLEDHTYVAQAYFGAAP